MRTEGFRHKVLLLLVLAGSVLVPTSQVRAQDSGSGAAATHEAGQSSRPAAQSSEASQEEKDDTEEYRQSPMVKTLGAKLGMKPAAASTMFEGLNFAVLAVAVGWFLAKALPKAFRNRTTVIQKHLVDARTATEEASLRLNSVEDRLSKLDGQIAAMRLQAERDSTADEQRIKATVEEEKQKVLAAAEMEIAAATTQARRHIQQYAAELAIDHAAKKLVISAETDRLLVENFVRRLGGEDRKGGQN